MRGLRRMPSHSSIVCKFYKIGVEGEPFKNKIIYKLNYFISFGRLRFFGFRNILYDYIAIYWKIECLKRGRVPLCKTGVEVDLPLF